MLQRIRDGLHGRKWLAWFALAPIALIFTFWGGSSSLDFSGSSRQDAAVVDGEKIPASKATKAWSETQARWSQQFGSEIPAEQRARIQDNILDQLVLEQLLENRLAAENYRVSEQRVLTEIQNFQPSRARMASTIPRSRGSCCSPTASASSTSSTSSASRSCSTSCRRASAIPTS